MKEPSLLKHAENRRTSEFRVVSAGILGIGGPTAWRLRVERDGSGTWTGIELDPCYLDAKGEEDLERPYGKPIRKTRKVPKAVVTAFLKAMKENSSFWQTPTIDYTPMASETEDILEIVQNGRYHVVYRPGFDPGAMTNIWQALRGMVKLTPLDFPELQQKKPILNK